MNLRVDKDILGPDDLDLIIDGNLYEFVGGMPVEKHMGAEADEVAMALVEHLRAYVRAHRLGRVFGPGTGYRCFPADSKQLRRPDVSFVARGRFPGDKAPRGNIEIAPDLAAEVVSPNDTHEEVEDKVADYRSAGVKLIWIITPGLKRNTVMIRRGDRTCAELAPTDDLSGEDVVPGFACKVADLFT